MQDLADRFWKLRRCRPPRSSAAPTGFVRGRAAWKSHRLYRKISRSKAVIAAWAITLRWSTPWPIVWPSPKANGRHSTAAAGAASCIRIPVGDRSQPLRRRGKFNFFRHGRACPGHPRLLSAPALKSWMPGTSPGMTSSWRLRASRTMSILWSAVVARPENALCVEHGASACPHH
jgi:hypothetical protein